MLCSELPAGLVSFRSLLDATGDQRCGTSGTGIAAELSNTAQPDTRQGAGPRSARWRSGSCTISRVSEPATEDALVGDDTSW